MRLKLILALVLNHHILSAAAAFSATHRAVRRSPFPRSLSRRFLATKPTSASADQIHDEVEVVKASHQYVPVYFDAEKGSDVLLEAIQKARREVDAASILNIVIPTIVPILAFFCYEPLANSFESFLDVVETKNWVAVDGGAYQAKVIAPAINGVVVPSIAILFATLTSTTISTLRARQVDIRRAINTEAGELRALECLLEAFPAGKVKDRCRSYLIQYSSRIIAESSPDIGAGENVVNPGRSMDSELNAFMNVLNKDTNGSNEDECLIEAAIPPHILSEVFSSVSKLRDQRHLRITALQSTYPALHYTILYLLALSICVAFLMETDQEYLVFLNAVQLKFLWSFLVGTFVSCFVVLADLGAPFSGSYQISASVDQLHTIRQQLQAAVQMNDMMRQEKEPPKRYPNGSQRFSRYRGQ